MKRNIFRKYCFNNHIKIPLFISLLIVWIMCQPLFGQTTEFVPENISFVSVNVSTSSFKDYYTKNAHKISVLDMLRRRNDIDTNAVTGSVRYENTVTQLHFQYGLFKSVNLGISVPYLNTERKSNLNLNDPAEATFAESLENSKASGLGDVEIWGLWQLQYTDQTDLKLGVKIIGDNAPLNSEEVSKMPLGSGSKELSLFLHWSVYSIQSSLWMFMEMEYVFTEDSEIKSTDGQKITKQKSNNFAAKIDVSGHSKQFGYGGGTRIRSNASQKLDGVSQSDGYLSYGLRAYLSYGNLYQLEKKIIRYPWETRIELEKVITGSNAPEVQVISLQFMTYF
jgi:hypothetical protein